MVKKSYEQHYYMMKETSGPKMTGLNEWDSP